jgi:hypothetical protein
LLDAQLASLKALGAAHAARPSDYTAKCKLLAALNATLEVYTPWTF